MTVMSPEGADSEASDEGELEKLSREVVEMLQAEKARKSDKKVKRKADLASAATEREEEINELKIKPDEE